MFVDAAQRDAEGPPYSGLFTNSGESASDVGQWLVEHRLDIDNAEAEWLENLGQFDREQLWALDGQFSCCSWLMWRTQMARSTAFEKLRVAHEMFRRPIIAEAFRKGTLSYSAVRVITRMERPSADVDQALVDLASSDKANVADIEKVVRSYEQYANQERPPADRALQARGVRIRRSCDGTGVGQVIVTLSDLEIEEFAVALQAFIDLRYRPAGRSPAGVGPAPAGARPASASPVDESPQVDTPAPEWPDGPVDESTQVDTDTNTDTGAAAEPGEAPLEEAGRAGRMADAFMDLVSAGLGAADGGHVVGADRYLVHFVTRDGGETMTLPDGRPVVPEDAGAVDCDSSSVNHSVDERGELLSLGRKTRNWSTAQRRAIRVRDAGRCRFPGCQYTYVDIHHIQPWDQGGDTDVANGCYQCRRHHRMIHAGYRVEGDPNGELRFYRPGGSYIGSTYGRLTSQSTRSLLTASALSCWTQ